MSYPIEQMRDLRNMFLIFQPEDPPTSLLKNSISYMEEMELTLKTLLDYSSKRVTLNPKYVHSLCKRVLEKGEQ